MHYPAASMTI